MSLKRRITRVEDQRFTSADRFSVLKNDGSCPAALSRPQPAMELQKKHSFALLSRSSLSSSPFLVSFPLGFRSIGVEERRATTKRKEFWNNDEEGGPADNDWTPQKFAINLGQPMSRRRNWFCRKLLRVFTAFA